MDAYLADPQGLNSYSYARNNPLILVDQSGELFFLAPLLIAAPALLAGTAAILPYLPALFDQPQDTARALPVTGDYIDAREALSGRDYFSGEQLSSGERLFTIGATALPVLNGSAIRQSFKSYSSFRNTFGSAGSGRQWHHIVEQNPTNASQFGQDALQNMDNIINLPADVHRRISGYYSSKQFFSGDLTVREWANQQSFEEQADFSRDILDKAQRGDL